MPRLPHGILGWSRRVVIIPKWGELLSELSEFEEMYLKRMFEILSQQPDAIVKTSMLAESMGVSDASTTEMIQKLAGRDLVTYIP